MAPFALGPFDLIAPVGVGGIGEVWRGVHRAQGVGVAIKVLTAANARKRGFRALFREEVRSVAGLDHPGIVLVLDVGDVDPSAAVASEGKLVAGSPYLAMELASGGSLDHHPRPTSWEGARDLLLAILDALAHAHARGVVHRDLKPGNVLVCTGSDPRPGLKLSDFGLAWAMDADPQDDRSVCGTPRYMAPEQFRGDWRAFGPWTDLYALGCLAWELLCGTPPWPEGDTATLARRHQVEPLPVFAPRFPVPDGVQAWLGALLEKSPAARAQRAADASLALRGLGGAEGGSGPLIGGAPAPTLIAAYSEDDISLSMPSSEELEDLPTEEEVPLWAADAIPVWPAPPIPMTWRSEAAAKAPMRLVGAGLGLYGLREIPIVGREAERDALWSALRAVQEGQRPRAVLLRGPSGVGTSRLAEWLCERADEAGAAEVLRAVHTEVGGPRDGVPGSLIRHLRVSGLAGASLASRIAIRLRDLGGHDEDDVQAIAAILSPVPEDQPTGAGSAVERWGAVRRYLRLLTRRRTVVIWLDDAQWGADALGFARWLLRPDPEPLPVLLVVTAREDGLLERSAEARLAEELVAAGASRIDVAALGASEAAVLARELIGLDGALARDVGRRCAGNPMFAVQLVRDWVQRGALVAGPGGFGLREGEQRALPDDIHGLWAARVRTAVEAAGKGDADRALEIAAVLGADVDTAEWESACAIGGVLVPEGLSDVLLARRLATGHEGGWSFAHGLLRESLVRSAREAGREARWNEICAEVLEAQEPKDGPLFGRIGMHWLGAGRPDRAYRPLGDSAMRAEKGGYLPDAMRLLGLRESAMVAAGIPEGDPAWASLHWMRAMTLVAQGRPIEGLDAVGKLIAGAERFGWSGYAARAARLQGTAAMVAGDFAAAEFACRRAVALAQKNGEIETEGAIWNSLADIARFRGEWALAEEHYLRSQALLANLQTVSAWAESMQGLAMCRRHAGRYAEASQLFERVVAWGEKHRVRNIRGNALNGLGEVARSQGRLEDAEAFYRAATAVLRTLGPERSVVPRMNLALVLILRGGFAEARPMLIAERARLEMRGRKALASGCTAMLATCAAADRDGPAFDRELAAVRAYREATGFVESDVAWAIDAAAAQWGSGPRAQAARDEAATMYRLLGK